MVNDLVEPRFWYGATMTMLLQWNGLVVHVWTVVTGMARPLPLNYVGYVL